MNFSARPSKGSPPRRAALHERSDSHTNERASPTLRIIGDPQAPIYASNPFPTKPSQFLSPKGYNGQGSTFGPGVGASNDQEQQRDTRNDVRLSFNTSIPRSQNGSTNPDNKDAIYTPAQGTIPGSETCTSVGVMDESIENDTSRLSDEIVQLPSISPGFDSSEMYDTADQWDAPRQPAAKDSDGSLSSSNSTGTVIVKKTGDGRKRASYSAFPYIARPYSSKSNISLSTPQKPSTRESEEKESPVSPISPAFLGHATPHERRISSVPLYANMHASSQNSVNLQYPIIRPPSASASWYVHLGITIVCLKGIKPGLLPGSLSYTEYLLYWIRFFRMILDFFGMECHRLRKRSSVAFQAWIA